MRLFFSIMAIIIVATQLFATRTFTGITGAVTQPSAEIKTTGLAADITYSGGSLREVDNSCFTHDFDLVPLVDGKSFGEVMDGNGTLAMDVAIGNASSFEGSLALATSSGLSSTGLNLKFQFLNSGDLRAAVGLGGLMYSGENDIQYKMYSYDAYGVVSYLFSENLTLSANVAYKGYSTEITYLGNDYDFSRDTVTYGLAANYDMDNFEFAADYMFGTEDDLWGLKAAYKFDKKWSASAGVIGSKDANLFCTVSYGL